MPLLNKKNFVINDPPPNLKDDEEVFYSELTNEIFRDYEEFCERIFLCNSLVWSCSYTGRSSLTYQEAVNSELVAKKMLNEFPLKLRIPVLYLTTLTERSSLLEFAEDVFAFARDRYFIGEEVEVCFANDNWSDCRIIKVQYPTQKRLQEYNQQNQKAKTGERDYWPPAALYSYEVETSSSTGPRHFVTADKVRRRKGVYTREKNRLYIKQFVERQGSVWKLKKSVYHKYGIDKVKFDMIFCGPAMASLAPTKKKVPNKKPIKETIKKEKEIKKQKVQGSIDKYFAKQKTGDKQDSSNEGFSKQTTPRKPAETPQKTLVQKLKNKYKMNAKNGKIMKNVKCNKNESVPRERKKKEIPIRKALSKDELQKLAFECKDKDVKEKFAFLKKNNLTKEDKVQVLALVKEYTKFREDLECSMLKELPAPLPIQMRIPNELFGDFLHMLEFFNSFNNVVNVRDFFSSGITFELLERALVEKEVAGPLSDVIHVLLVTLFDLQDQEDDSDDKLSLDSVTEQQNEKSDSLINFRLAVAAAIYSQQYHGHPINELTLDSASLTEVLRLHIISSGRRLIDDSDQSRREPTLSIEDPCSALCLTHPHVLNALSQKSIFELPIEDKVLIINSLINQILSFASIKESIEEECENLRMARHELRMKRAAEVRRLKEAEKELKEQQKGEDKDKEKSDKDKEKSNRDKDEEKGNSEEDGGVDAKPKTRLRLDKNLVLKARELAELELRVQCLPLGMDRAFRRYWMFYSTPGLYVEDNEPFPGTCLPRDVIESLCHDSPVKFVRRLFDEGSDKENFAGSKTNSRTSSLNSPSKKLLVEKNGDAVSIGGAAVDASSPPANVKIEPGMAKPSFCTGDALLCPIHGTNRMPTTFWSFYKDEADLNALIDSLSKYGVRESHLRKELIKNKQRIIDSVKRCPHSKLNPSVPEDPEQLEIKKSTKSGPKYLNPHLDFPPDTPIDEILISSLTYMILETEDKIYAGHIGTLKVKDRVAWRNALNEKIYDKQCDELTWGPNRQKNWPEAPSDESGDNKEATGSQSSTENIERLMRTDVETPKKEVFDLACAILQIEQAIEHRFLKKPFGVADCKEKDKEKAESDGYKLRERWELSLMASCSISQLFVHIYSLDNHIAWSRSALKASCRICRRVSNPESMLLCDMCNKGHHLYCLKPPLKKVPEGDWFCPSCSPKPSPVKRSRKEKMDVDDNDLEDCKVLGNCKACKCEGDMVVCDSCGCGLHLECINPPLKRFPRSKWTCNDCRQNSKKDELWSSGGEVERTSRRRCAKAATAKISQFAKQLRTQAWDESGSGTTEEDEKEREDMARRRSRRSLESGDAHVNSCAVLRSDLPLDNAALQEVLDVLMHNKDAWPFLRPVTKAEVPDYRNIIKKPMDFGTIKHKLNMFEYSKNSQVIADALLVFDNCYTYNQPESEVFKAGERLQKLFEKLCSERKMNIDVDFEVRPPSQKKAKLM